MNKANSSPARDFRDSKDQRTDRPWDIRERTFQFSIRICKLVEHFEKSNLSFRSIRNQLLRSGTSIGANLEEANAAQSKRDFIHKNTIALKEARESIYWIRLLSNTVNHSKSTLNGLHEMASELNEISRIIGKIIVNARKPKEKPQQM